MAPKFTRAEITRRYRERHREELNARERLRYRARRDRVLAHKKEYYIANREAIRAQQSAYERANLAVIRFARKLECPIPQARDMLEWLA